MGLLAEFRRRNVFKVGVTYAIVAWLLVQIVVSVKTPLHLPDWADTLVIILLGIGFPVALVLAWAFDLTPQGIRRTGDIGDTREASSDPVGARLARDRGQGPLPQQDQTTPAASAISEQSIAVLPFVNMSSDPEQEYFSDGITEELINQLVKLRGLHVTGRTSSFHFKGRNEDLRAIGAKLGVAHVLEGSVRKAGSRVRITAQLIKVSNGFHLWSENYDCELADIFGVQEQTGRAVAESLRVTLGIAAAPAAGGTRNFAAYDTLLAARALIRQSGRNHTVEAIARIERVLELDPGFGDAWAELALSCYMAFTFFVADRGPEFRARARVAAQRALVLAPDSVTTLRASALLDAADFLWRAADTHFERALRASPADPVTNQSYAQFLSCVGGTRRAIEHSSHCVASEPLWFGAAMNHAVSLELIGELDRSLAECDRCRSLLGDDASMDGPRLVIAMTRRDRAAMEALYRSSEALQNHVMPGDNVPLSRLMFERLDEPAKALEELRRLAATDLGANPFICMVMALWASWFDAHELALELFRRIAATRSYLIVEMWRPLHAPMRQLPGFKPLLREVGLVDYWRETGDWGEFCRPLGADDFECYR